MGIFDGPVDTSFPISFGTPSGVPNNAATANEGGFNLGKVLDSGFNLAGQIIPAYLYADAAKKTAKSAVPVGIIVVGGLLLALLLLRK